MLKRIMAAAIAAAGFLIVSSPALATSYWEDVTEGHEIGFDFRILADVQGPDSEGLYTYSYLLYRVDQGGITYRSPSHISIRFECAAEAAVNIILGGGGGITLGGQSGKASGTEVARDPYGFVEPGLSLDSRTNGIKLDFLDGALVPNGDGVSYPADPDDPVLVVSFRSLAPPTAGFWFVKGGRKLTGSVGHNGEKPPITFLTDGGSVLVPACQPPVPVQSTTWSRIKQAYR